MPLVVTVVKFPNVKVALLVGRVNVILLRVVIVAAPNVGVVNVGDVKVLFVNVSVPSNVANVPTLVGNVILTAFELLPTKFILPLVVTVVKLPNVNVPFVCDIVILLMLVAVAAPNVGVVSVGDVKVLFVNVSVPVIVE